MERNQSICVIGGAGRSGLPLALTLADCGLRTAVFDIARPKIAQLRRGELPFMQEGGAEILARTLAAGTFSAHDTPECIRDCELAVLVVGTPVDKQMNPELTELFGALDQCAPHMRDGQVLILRSTVFPGLSRRIQRYFDERGLDVRVSFCPERVAQGHALRELRDLPQIISAFDAATLERVRALFVHFCPALVEMEPMEAELAKLMTNAWRYIQFATANQFYTIATRHGLDFNRILHGVRHEYPRTAGMPGPGFAAGPCLKKDTMQLAAFSHDFSVGLAALQVNEGLPTHLVELAERSGSLENRTAGILGTAFKAGCDDTRDSLSFKLRKLLTLKARRVIWTDPYVVDPAASSLPEVIAAADVLFIATPHEAYRGLDARGKLVIDPWNITR